MRTEFLFCKQGNIIWFSGALAISMVKDALGPMSADTGTAKNDKSVILSNNCTNSFFMIVIYDTFYINNKIFIQIF